MSMPSSRLEVATSAGSRPALSSSSMKTRCSRATLPWWARTSSSPASSLSRWASRSESRRLLVKTIVLRWLRISSRIRGWIAGQMLVRMSPRVAGPPGCSSGGRTSPRAAMSSTGTTTWRSSGLRAPASTTVTSRSGADPAEEPGDRLERPLRGGQADPLHRAVGRPACRSRRRLEPLEAERQVRAALRAGDGVDLVDDHVLDAAQDLAGGAGQHQVERLGGRDQDVRWVAGDLAPVLGRGVAGPAGDRDARHRLAESLGGQRDPGQRGAQVALDVVGQRLERRDVEDADGAGGFAGRRRARVGGEPVEGPQERGQGLAAPRRGVDQRVLAARDGRPAPRLGVGRRLEAGPEPVTDGWREGRERIGDRGDCGHRAAQCTARPPFRPDVRFAARDPGPTAHGPKGPRERARRSGTGWSGVVMVADTTGRWHGPFGQNAEEGSTMSNIRSGPKDP